MSKHDAAEIAAITEIIFRCRHCGTNCRAQQFVELQGCCPSCALPMIDDKSVRKDAVAWARFATESAKP